MNAWFSFFTKIGITFFFLDLIVIVFIFNHKQLFNRIYKNKEIFFLIIIAYLIGARNIDSWKWCVMIFPVLTLLFAKNELLSQVLISTSKWLAIILVPGIILHLIMFIQPISPIGPQIYIETFYGSFNNYILYIKSTDLLGYVFRFSSIFIEPGHLGMILSYYLFALKYNYRSIVVWIFTVALLLTLSLAGYVLFIGGAILYSMSISIKSTFKNLIYGIIGIIILTYFITLVLDNSYVDYVKSVTVDRLEFDEKKGIKGNNRTNESADIAFDKLVASPRILWGLGSKKYRKEAQKRNWIAAGYKVFILNYGLISLLLISYAYFKIGKNKKVTFCFFILISMSFIQRAYPFWAAWLVPYICFCLNTDYQRNLVQTNNLKITNNNNKYRR